MVTIELNGSHAEIGYQRGRQLKYAIQLAMEHWGPDSHRYTRKEAHAHGRRMAADMEKRCPAIIEEITATARGADVALDDMLAYAFRCWNALVDHPATLACYNMACRDPNRGLILAGVLEDSPPFYLQEIVRPARGHAYFGITWAGMAWACRCLNQAGLAIGQSSSFAGTRFRAGGHKFPFDLYARGYYAQRYAAQHCDNIADAIDVFRRFECASVFMIADKSGRAVTCEACGKLAEVRQPDKDGIMTGGTFESPALIKKLIDQGIAHDWEQNVRLAKKVSTKLRQAKGKTTMEWMAKYLQGEQSNGGWCHDGLQAATIACPATGEFWTAGYRCVGGFKKYSTKQLSARAALTDSHETRH